MHQVIRPRFIWIFFMVLFHFCLSAQLQTLKFITYTTNNGLLHNYTKKCVEDPKGFIWVVSEIGLSRFDGVNFQNFQNDENDPSSLPHNTVNDIDVDEAGRIWLALENGLCYYDPKEGCFNSIDIQGTFNEAPAVLSLCMDTLQQALWFMTDKALYRLNTIDFTVKGTSCTNPTPTKINSIYLDSDRKLWIACYRHGFIRYDIAADEATLHLPEIWIMSFHEGSNHLMWMGNWHSQQLISWDMVTGKTQSWKGEDNASMIVTGISKSPFFNNSMLLLSTLHMGLRMFDTHRKEFAGGFSRDIFSKYSLPTDFINFIYTDSRNIVWLCTWEGLCKVNMLEQQFRSLEIPFLSTPMFQYYNLVEGIVSADEPGIWWLGIDGCGVIKYDTAGKKLLLQLLGDISKPNNFELPSWTEFLIKTEDGIVWTVNANGVAGIKGDVITQYEPQIQTLKGSRKTVCIGPDKTFWISTATHVVNFDPITKEYASYDIDTSKHGPLPTRAVAESGFCNDGNLWCGTFKGLFQFNPNSHVSRRIDLLNDSADSLEINTINSLATDGQETIYMGTPVGLGIYNIRTGQYQLKGEKDQVYPILWKSLLRDRAGNVWIYTTHALFKYDLLRDEFSKFTTSDGIYNFSSDPTHLFAFNQNFYIGYRGAYTEFDPLKVGVNQTMVKPLIADVVIGDQIQKFDPEIYSSHYLPLTARDNDVTFHFTGIDYTNSDRITFIYKLNKENEWHEGGTNRSLTYTNLPPGRHTFQLRARNSSGILSNQIAVFKLSIAPSLIQRWWFWPLMAFFFVTIVFFIANRRVKKIKKEEKRKTEANKMLAELETKLLRSQMNPHFIFNSLNSIQKYIWENKEEDAAEYLAQFAKLIRAILENSRKESISLRKELEVLKLYIELEHRRSDGKFDYHIMVAEDLNPDDLEIPPLLIQPYIENAIWHGVNKKPGQGHIEISIRKVKDVLEFVIDDDGVGRTFKKAEANEDMNGKTSLGTDITQLRISYLNTKDSSAGVRFVDKTNNGMPTGTTVIVTIPIKDPSYA